MMKNELDLEKLERLCKKATPGPWYLCGQRFCTRDPQESCNLQQCMARPFSLASAKNSEFVIAAREALPALIAEVRRLRAYEPVGQEFDWGSENANN